MSNNDVECIAELIENDGTSTTLCSGNGKLFKLSSGALVELTYGGGGVAPTITENNWNFTQLNGVAMFWQREYDPLIYDPAVSTTTYRRLSEKSGSTGTVYQCNVAISAYGRVWAADTSTDKQTIVFSDLLTPHIWTGGTSGSLDLRQVWPSGGDEIVGFAAHNGFLFIFGRWQILIYSGADDPETMKLNDSIVGIGCISRDSIQNTGGDVIFLSDIGVVSLRRVIQEKSAPFSQMSRNVANDLQEYLDQEAGTIKSGYSALNQFYLLTLPTAQRTYCFDTRQLLQDGSSRASVWTGTPSTAFYETKDRAFYLGKPGYIGEYGGYNDRLSTYRMSYYSTWIDFGNSIQTSILKKIFADIIANANQSVVFKWGFDFLSALYSETVVLPASVTTSAEYGNAEYGIDEYSGNTQVTRANVNGSGYGRVIQIGIEATINGSQFAIQKIDIFTKDGKL